MTLDELLDLARRQLQGDTLVQGASMLLRADAFARWIVDTLGEAQPCGFESIAPTVAGTPDGLQVRIPDFMTFEPSEARAYAAMLLRAADEAER